MKKSPIPVLFIFLGISISQPVQAVEVPPQPLQRIAPWYDREGRAQFKEGWVYLEYRITSQGKVDDVEVVSSYPKGVFESDAIAAVRQWTYSPRLVDGTPTDHPAFREHFLFSIDGVPRGISKALSADFKDLAQAVLQRDSQAAEKYLPKLRALYDAGTLEITEVAHYFQYEGYAALDRQDYAKAREWFEFALRLRGFFDNKKTSDTLHYQMIVAYLGLTQYDIAVAYYDAWSKQTSIKLAPESIAAIEKLRSQGFGKAGPYLTAFGDDFFAPQINQTRAGRTIKPAPSPSALP